jgi:hypothetical protein
MFESTVLPIDVQAFLLTDRWYMASIVRNLACRPNIQKLHFSNRIVPEPLDKCPHFSNQPPKEIPI